MTTAKAVYCGGCQRALIEAADLPRSQRVPCPECGSTLRRFSVHLQSEGRGHSTLALKAKSPGMRKPFLELKQGDDLHRVTGLWSSLLRVIDRRRNRYQEQIVDIESGEILRNVDEPLTDHRGRGSAKGQSDEPDA